MSGDTGRVSVSSEGGEEVPPRVAVVRSERGAVQACRAWSQGLGGRCQLAM